MWMQGTTARYGTVRYGAVLLVIIIILKVDGQGLDIAQAPRPPGSQASLITMTREGDRDDRAICRFSMQPICGPLGATGPAHPNKESKAHTSTTHRLLLRTVYSSAAHASLTEGGPGFVVDRPCCLEGGSRWSLTGQLQSFDCPRSLDGEVGCIKFKLLSGQPKQPGTSSLISDPSPVTRPPVTLHPSRTHGATAQPHALVGQPIVSGLISSHKVAPYGAPSCAQGPGPGSMLLPCQRAGHLDFFPPWCQGAR